MSMKRKRIAVGSPPSSSKFDVEDSDKVYLLYSLFEGPVSYVMYKLDTSAIGGNDDDEGNDSTMRIPYLTTVFELPSEKYPPRMGCFAMGSRIYLLGGEVRPHHKVDFVGPRQRVPNTTRISEKVYFFDTATVSSSSSSASSSPLSVAPPMRGGKKSPLAIHVYGLVYVISSLPNHCTTYFTESEPLFEVFDPQGGNEGEGGWFSLPNPPFYPRSSKWTPHIDGVSTIESHVVVDRLICFFTSKRNPGIQGIDAVYVFDVLSCNWVYSNSFSTGSGRLRLIGEAMLVSDFAWAAIGGSFLSWSPISTYDLLADFGLVGRDVEGLDTTTKLKPPLAYGIHYRLLEMRNGWFCLLKFGRDAEGFRKGKDCVFEGKAYVSATVFRLVKKRKDKVFSRELHPYMVGQLFAPYVQNVSEAVGEIQVFGAEELRSFKLLDPDVQRDVSKAVGEVQVFGAEELRSSLFALGVESFNTVYTLVGCLAM